MSEEKEPYSPHLLAQAMKSVPNLFVSEPGDREWIASSVLRGISDLVVPTETSSNDEVIATLAKLLNEPYLQEDYVNNANNDDLKSVRLWLLSELFREQGKFISQQMALLRTQNNSSEANKLDVYTAQQKNVKEQ